MKSRRQLNSSEKKLQLLSVYIDIIKFQVKSSDPEVCVAQDTQNGDVVKDIRNETDMGITYKIEDVPPWYGVHVHIPLY